VTGLAHQVVECIDCGWPTFRSDGHAPFCGRLWVALPVFDHRAHHVVVLVPAGSDKAAQVERWRQRAVS